MLSLRATTDKLRLDWYYSEIYQGNAVIFMTCPKMQRLVMLGAKNTAKILSW